MRVDGIVRFAILAAAVSGLSPAFAATTVTPIRTDGTTLTNVTSTTAYYPVSPLTEAGDGTYFLDLGDTTAPERVYNVTNTQTELASGGLHMLRFSFFSNKSVTPPAGGRIVVAVTINGTGGVKLVPIASMTGSASCSNCQGVITVGAVNYYFAARYTTGSPMQIGFYPADICTIYNAQTGGGNAYGCTGANVVDTATTATAMTLNFFVTTVTNDTETPAASALGASDATLSLRFQATAPVLGCPSMSEIYFPGDSKIYLNAMPFTLSSGVSPLLRVIVAGNESPTAAVATSAFESANVIRSRVNLGPQETVEGFTNTTNGADHQYNLAFMARDLAGIVATGSGACSLSGVQTADVQGFLKQSGCFIATAAFRSGDAAPVAMLREFRDRVLLKTGAGRSFVDLYYRWSPGAAEWLMRNPVFRVPVLLALIPVQVIAWLFLHPVWLAILAIGNVLVFAKGFRREAAR